MKILLNIMALSLLCSLQGFSQVATNNTNTVAWYVQNVLLGPNVTVSNITYNGSAANANVAQPSVGEFTNPALQIGLASGMIIASGDIGMASQPNNSGSQNLGNAGPQPAGNDPDLASIVSGTQFDKCIVEFDFVPNGDSIRFNYVFASEEYPEYVCSGFNDAFGFFLSGPNPSGGNYTNFNVARVPNTLNPLTFTNTPVAINTINPGVSGTFGTASNCSAIDPNWVTYNVYYTSNTTNAYQYDGRTTLLPVAVPVICGQTYHIKLAVADLGDALFDSGVFLEEGSFASNGIDASGATAPGDVFLCTTDLTLNFSAGATPPPYSFWDFGDGTGTSTQPNPTYTFIDTGYYQVMYVAIDSVGLCALRDTVYFDVNLIYPPQFNATFDIPVVDPCSGIDSLLVDIEFTGTGADSLIWNMGNGDIFYNVDSVDYYYTNTGNYIISLTAIDTVCGNDTTITTNVDYVLNFSQAQATAPDDVILCGSPFDVSFTAGTNPPPDNFWDFGDGSGTSTLPNPVYTYADSGSYQVMYVAIDSSTCNIADTVYFSVELIIPPQFSAVFNIPPFDPCSGIDSLLVDIEFIGSGADSLIWNMGNGDIFYNVDSVDYYYTNTGNYIISLTAIDTVCGNDTTITTNVDYVLNFSQAQATAPDDVILCGSPFDVSFTAGTNPPPDNFWDFGDGSGTSTLPNPVYTYADSGSYQVMYVAIDSSTCNIADTVYFSVELIIPPQFSAVFNIPPFDPCSGVDSFLVDIAFTGTGADSLIWNMGNGDIFYNVDSVDYYYTTTGTYVIAMTAIDTLCNNDTTIFTTVNYFLDSSVAQANVPEDILLCTTPLNVDFSAGPNPPPHNFWDFGDGSGTSTLPDVTYTYADTGSYQVMYVAIDSSTCNIADTVYFSVQLAQAEQFSATINFQPPPRCGSDTLILDLAFTGSGADSIIWNMGNGDIFYTDSILYYYTVPGIYTVSMTAFDTACNNVETISNEIVFAGNIDTEVKVPNIFTPNGDNVNEEFETTSVDATKEYRMTIFNRWGRKVFETEDAMMFWDGKVNGGSDAETGVYFYEVVYTDICSDEQKVQTGTVYIAR